MGNREAFYPDLAHDGCDKAGRATVRENANSVFTNGVLDPSIREVPPGFSKSARGVTVRRVRGARLGELQVTLPRSDTTSRLFGLVPLPREVQFPVTDAGNRRANRPLREP